MTEDLEVTAIGCQIVLELRQGGQVNDAVVHWEQNGHSGLAAPPWANPHEVVRRAALLLHEAADAIARQVPAEGV